MKLIQIGLALLLILSLTLFTAGPVSGQQDNPQFAPDRVLLKFKAGTDAATQGESHRKQGGVVIDEIRPISAKMVRVPA